MPKSLRDLVVDDTVVSEKPVNGNGLRSLIVDEDVKKKSKPDYEVTSYLDLATGLQKSKNISLTGATSESQSLSEENPYSQLLNTHKDNTTASIDVAKSYLEQDFNDRQSKINASPLLQQFDKPLDEGLTLSQAKDEAGNVVRIANPNMNVADYNKSVIFSNPQALKKYRQIRESEINANTSKLKQDESNLPEAHRFITKDAQAEYFQNNPEYQQLQSAITKNKDQKDELKKSVANIAKIIIPKEAIESGKPVDIQKIGEDYLKVVGDPQVGDDKKTLRAIDNGLEKSQEDIDRSKQNIQYKFFKTGAGVLSDYYLNHSDDLYKKAKPKIATLEKLFNDQQEVKTDESKSIIQNHINDYLQDDDVKNYISATRNAIDYYNKSQNAAEQFPQVQRAINRQKLNDAFFEWNKIKDNIGTLIPGGVGYNALKYLSGAQPRKDEIPLLASMAGISEDEAQKIYDEKIKGFIGEADTGVRIDGLLLGLAKGTDETLAKSLMGVRRFLHTDDVEAKNRLLNDRLVNYNLESQQNKLKDDFDKWNINPYSIFNTMGNGIGQTAIYGLPALATGGFTEGVLLKNSKLLANLSKKVVEGSVTVATGYAGSYEDSYKEAAKYTDDEKLRRAYANVTAYENALPELLLSPAEVLKKVGIGKKIGGEAFETFAKDAAKDGIEKTVSQRLAKSLKEFANVIGAENIEEQATNISNIETKKSQLGVETTSQEAIKQAIETAVQTTITTLPLGIGAGMNANNDESGIRKEGLFEAGNEPDLYKEKLKKLFDNGVLNQAQYDKKVQVVNTMQNIVAAVNKTTKADGKPLTYDEKANLAAQQFRIDNNNFILKNNPITANEKIIEADNNEALNIQNEILIGKKNIPSQLKSETNEEASLPQAKAEGEKVNAREGEAAKATPSFTGLSHIQSAAELLRLGKIDSETHALLVDALNGKIDGTDAQKETAKNDAIDFIRDEKIKAENEPINTTGADNPELSTQTTIPSSNVNKILEEAKGLSDDVQGIYAGAFKKDPERTLFEAATQLNSSESEAKTARSIFGERLSKIALELFPNAKVGDVYESKTTEVIADKTITGSAKDNEQLGKSSIEIKQAEKVDGEDLQSQQKEIDRNGLIKIIESQPDEVIQELKKASGNMNLTSTGLAYEYFGRKDSEPMSVFSNKIESIIQNFKEQPTRGNLEFDALDKSISEMWETAQEKERKIAIVDKYIEDHPEMSIEEQAKFRGNPPESIFKTEPTLSNKDNSVVSRSDVDIEKRMLEIQDSNPSFDSKEQKEFNALEKEMEKRERATVFNAPLEKVSDAVDALMKKEKEQPNGFGSFIEKRDARETKDVADRYLKPNDISDSKLKKDFKDALQGNPATWYADGLKLRESMKLAAERGITTDELFKPIEDEFIRDGYTKEEARNVIKNDFEPLLKEATKPESQKQLPQPKQDNSVVEGNKVETEKTEPLNTEQNTIPPEPPLTETKVGDTARELANRIRQLRPKKDNTVKATIFALPIAIYDTVIVTIANAIEAGASLADAIQKGIDYIHSLPEHSDWEDEGGKFKQHIEDAVEGKKPTVTVQTKPEENAKEEIDAYAMTSSDEVNKFLSGSTIDDVFGEAPEGEQSYYVQKLTDMLQDGKNMIAKAMNVWGNDISEYGKPLFQYIQNMSNDNQLTNKKAVLLATFLGEIKEAIIREPERAGELRQLNNAVESYYQNYMNIKGKEVVAGRLLRLYRDHYIGDIFADKILEEKEIKDKRDILKAEQDAKNIDDLVAAKVKEQMTAQEKKDADAADKKASDKDKKTNDKKKSLSQKDAQAKADKKLSEIKDRLGKDADKGLIAKINDLVNKLNCK